MMTEKEIIKDLQGLRTITPDSDYIKNSRSLILSSGKVTALHAPKAMNVLTQGLNFALSTTFLAAALFIIILGGSLNLLKTIFLPPLEGVGSQSLITEANTISQDIDIRLKEIDYLTEERPVVALRAEINAPAFEKTADHEIDQLLNQVISY